MGSQDYSNWQNIKIGDNYHWERYQHLAKVDIINTKFVDDEVLSTLGIREPLMEAIDNIGRHKFINLKYHTYPTIFIEFLSSLKVGLKHGEDFK